MRRVVRFEPLVSDLPDQGVRLGVPDFDCRKSCRRLNVQPVAGQGGCPRFRYENAKHNLFLGDLILWRRGCSVTESSRSSSTTL